MSKIKSYVVAGSMAVSAFVGLAVAPLAGAVTDTLTLNASIQGTISIDASADDPLTLTINPVAGGNQTTDSADVTVTTNNSAGYTLSHYASASTLTKGGDTIPSTSGTWVSPVILANNTWGYAVASGTADLTPGSNGFDASYSATSDQSSNSSLFAAVPTSTTILRSTSAEATSGETTTFWYSAKADQSNPTGTYTVTITYEALTK